MTSATLGDTRQATAIARHWIDGRWRDSAEHKDSINPATGEVIARYALAGESEAREAVAAALTSFRQTNWKNDRALRSRALHEMAERFEAHTADLIISETTAARIGRSMNSLENPMTASLNRQPAARCVRWSV